jgi:hypothetical protein
MDTQPVADTPDREAIPAPQPAETVPCFEDLLPYLLLPMAGAY